MSHSKRLGGVANAAWTVLGQLVATYLRAPQVNLLQPLILSLLLANIVANHSLVSEPTVETQYPRAQKCTADRILFSLGGH